MCLPHLASTINAMPNWPLLPPLLSTVKPLCLYTVSLPRHLVSCKAVTYFAGIKAVTLHM